MAESNAFLAYGITVTTESLLYAVAAWPRLQGPFAFLDLVAQRKRKGTLYSAGPPSGPRSPVEAVPVEVWDVVRHKLVDLELKAAQIEHVNSLLCDECQASDTAANENLSWSDVFALSEHDAVYNFEGLAGADRQQAARSSVSAFGLALPTLVPIRANPHSDYPYSHASEPDTATLISLPGPPSSGADAFALRAACGGDMGPDGQAVVDVSFSIPAGAKQRFRRLVSTTHVQLVDISDGYIANAGTKAAKGNKDGRRTKRKFKKVPLAKLEPRWKLVTMAETHW